jgi:hypothetical protein
MEKRKSDVCRNLKKAFDTVEACVKEETSIQWYGQRTQYETKSKGVKQGFPLSYTLFEYALHDVLRRMAKIMPTKTLT